MTVALPVREIQSAHLSDVGRVRSENQDACAELENAAGARLLVVADGMGGHRGGSIASRLAIEAVSDVFQGGGGEGGELLAEALAAANARVHERSVGDPALHGMGTTAVALLLEDGSDTAWVGHVGDSRLYRLRAGKLQQITEDHSAVADLVRRGAITPEEAVTHPRRNEILRSLGVESDVEADVAPLDLQPGDQVLLCSDGLSGVLTDAEIEAVLQRSPPAQAVRILVDSANSRGGPDNVTVMIAAVPGPAAAETRVPAQPAAAAPSSSQNVRRIAAAAGAVLVALVLLLLFALVRGDWTVGGTDRGRTADLGVEDLALPARPVEPGPQGAAGTAPPVGGAPETLEPVR